MTVLHKRVAMACITGICSAAISVGQTVAGGTTINEYSAVSGMWHASDTDPDSVAVSEPGIFTPGDTVLFYIARGAEVYNPLEHPGIELLWGKILNMNNTGIYSIMIVASVSDSVVVFTRELPPLIAPPKPQMAQLVRIHTADRLLVDSTLRCSPWNPQNGTGGIMVLLANQSITLDGSIDATGKGFLGGSPSAKDFGDTCKAVEDKFMTETAGDSSGMKGESIVYPGFTFLRGNGALVSGGGGGNGRFAGGGGGANIGQGGAGGNESDECGDLLNPGGRSSYLSKGYFENTGVYANRLFMGGGGGSSTQDLSGHDASAGGNGGGIIIILTDTLVCTGQDTIRANGQNVTDTATAGAGGGGGGGIIVFDAHTVVGSLRLEVRGGDGGRTSDPDHVTGPGGFGGGGLIWTAGDSLPENVSSDTLNGDPGYYIQSGVHYGATTSQTSTGSALGGLISPLKGFLFNHAASVTSLCGEGSEDTIRASHPKGGNGTYDFLWQASPDRIAWSTAPGISDGKDYLPGESSSGMYFRRIVSSGEFSDTGRTIRYDHHPPITGNLIEGPDDHCAGDEFESIGQSGSPVAGGSGLFAWTWQQKKEGGAWEDARAGNGMPTFTPSVLDTLTSFRRIVQSGGCSDTSNVVKIILLEPVMISADPFSDTVDEDSSVVFTVKATGTPPLAYQWYFDDTELEGNTGDSLVIDHAAKEDEGDYTCLVSNACGGIFSLTATLNVIETVDPPDTTGIGSLNKQARIYPNPAKDQVRIEVTGTAGFEVSIFDMRGLLLKAEKGREVLDVSLLPPGIYLLKVRYRDRPLTDVFRLEITR